VTQNIYDDPTFFSGYNQLDRSKHGLDGAPEWASLRALLPPLAGLRVLDLGCGFGWFCRYAHAQGAAHVMGLDVSENMLERARHMSERLEITYERQDLSELDLPAASTDLIYSSLAFHYIEDFTALMKNVVHALAPGGRLVFSIEHPIYMAPSQPDWQINADGIKTWPLNSYQIEGPRTTNWLANGVLKYHRTLGTTLNTLIQCGLRVTHVEEWQPSAEQLTPNPQWREELDRPMFLLIGAQLDSGRL